MTNSIEIPLSKGKYAIIDKEDLELIMRYKWYHSGPNKSGYATRAVGRGIVFLHNYLMQPSKGMVVDHKNGNSLDYRRDNLRICTQLQNMCNRRKGTLGVSDFKGIHKERGKWKAVVTKNRKRYYLGRFNTEIEAAEAYNQKAKELHGEFASLNSTMRVKMVVTLGAPICQLKVI